MPEIKKYIPKLATFILTLSLYLLFSGTCHAGNYTRYTFKNTNYDKVWQACIEARDNYGSKNYSKSTAAGKVTFETKADKEEGILAFVSGEGILKDTQNTIKFKKFGKTAVMVLIRTEDNAGIFPWGAERNKEKEKKLMKAIRDIIEGTPIS